MALIKLGAFVTEISGKIGGTIFSRSKGGSYAKNRVIPLNPQTAKQNVVRQVFGAISQAWRSLTAAQRKAWEGASADYPYQNRLGETKNLTGSALHQRLNLNLDQVDAGFIAAPLSPQSIANASSLVVVMTAGGVKTVNAQVAAASLNTAYSIEATPSVSAGISNVSNKYRRIGKMNSVDANTAFDIDAMYTAVFGEPLAGAKVFVRVRPVNTATGQAGILTSASTVVV